MRPQGDEVGGCERDRDGVGEARGERQLVAQVRAQMCDGGAGTEKESKAL